MKRFTASALIVLALLFALPAPVGAYSEVITLKSSGAQTGPGQSTQRDIGNWRSFSVSVGVSAGSGTVNPFRVWIEGYDGAVWVEIPCSLVLKSGATAPGTAATQRDIVNEAAVVTSANYHGLCETRFSLIRAAWNIAGTTPSETFYVQLNFK